MIAKMVKRKLLLFLICGAAAFLMAVLFLGRPVAARPALSDYVGELGGYETVRATRQDGLTLTLEGERAAELRTLLSRFSFAGAEEEPPSRENSAPGFEALVRLESSGGRACSIAFVAAGPEHAHVRVQLPDGTEVHLLGDFGAAYRAAADFINAL